METTRRNEGNIRRPTPPHSITENAHQQDTALLLDGVSFAHDESGVCARHNAAAQTWGHPLLSVTQTRDEDFKGVRQG